MRRIHWEIGLHLLFWLLCYWIFLSAFALNSFFVEEINGVRETRKETTFLFFPVLFFLLSKAVIFYGNGLHYFPKFLKDKNQPAYLIKVFLLLVLVHLLESAFNYLTFQMGGTIDFRPYLMPLSLGTLFSVVFLGLSNAYVLGKNYWKNEQQRQQLKREKLNAELQFLKAQINPHFLFNTLNNLFALSERSNNPELSKGITALSNLMRYRLHDARANWVWLEQEIVHLKSVIEMQQLRLDEEDEVTISLNIEGDYSQKKIAPLLLIPFVENAFKHGIRLEEASFVKIHLVVDDREIRFCVSNSNFAKRHYDIKESSGIGLENVKRRLALTYPNQYDLQIEEGEDLFKVELRLYGKWG